jgi:hypothetical protein
MNPVVDRPTIEASAPDLDLLRRFEPVVCYTRGEQFYPSDIDRYLVSCSLWEHDPDGHDVLLVPEDQVTLDSLITPRPAEYGSIQYLKLVGPLGLAESARALAEQSRKRRRTGDKFHAGIGRLARGGYLPRLADALFSGSLLLRGRVPGAIAAAAELEYADRQREKEQYVYNGRVVRDQGWVILQYWFFYFFNSWRSGFHGMNDHEADWEMISVYLYEQDGRLIPEWAAFASHDFRGDDMRRRWDDRKELDLQDGHPVVYAGAGSHASYFRHGEYQAEVDLPIPAWLSRGVRLWRGLWERILGIDLPGGEGFRIPFVDYARGDGLRVGPGQVRSWTPVVIDQTTPWVSRYRGLWGLFARDPISGENAPAGPMYNRDGSPRDSWVDPLGFAGLDKVAPPPEETRLLADRCGQIENRQAELSEIIPPKATELRLMGSELRAIRGNPYLARRHATLTTQAGKLGLEIRELRREDVQNDVLLEGLNRRLAGLKAGVHDSPWAHIQHLAAPVSVSHVRFNRLVEGWAAVSISLMLLVTAVLLVAAPQYLWPGIGIMLLVFILLESILRGAFPETVASVAVVLASISSLILVIHYWTQIIVAGLIGIAVLLLVQKLRELRS